MLVFVLVNGCALKYNVNKFPIEKYLHVHVYFFNLKPFLSRTLKRFYFNLYSNMYN